MGKRVSFYEWTSRKPPSKKVLQKYWDMLMKKEEWFYGEVMWIEQAMAKATGVEDIEFIKSDGEYCGIGNGSRTMKLVIMR